MDLRAKIEETFLAPVGCALMARDTRIVERDGWYQVITPSSGSVSGAAGVTGRRGSHVPRPRFVRAIGQSLRAIRDITSSAKRFIPSSFLSSGAPPRPWP